MLHVQRGVEGDVGEEVRWDGVCVFGGLWGGVDCTAAFSVLFLNGLFLLQGAQVAVCVCVLFPGRPL